MPTSVDFVRHETGQQMVVGYTSGASYVVDLETGQVVVKLDQACEDGQNQVNCVVSHPTAPLTVSAHDDRHIKVCLL